MTQVGRKRMSFLISSLLILFSIAVLTMPLMPKSYAHFDHFSMYNGRGEAMRFFYVNEALEPDYARPGEPTRIRFSIQDKDGNDVSDVNAMIEVYSASSGERIQAYPWTKQESGDFEVPYVFPAIGSYQIVLSVADGPVNLNTIDAARTILSSSRDCDCERAIFNVSISESFGTVWSSTMLISVLAPLALVGTVLGMTFVRRMRTKGADSTSKLFVEECLRYAVMLSAIAGGMVHLAVYSMHASLRIEYSYFLLIAGGIQIAYGVLYIMITIAGQPLSTKENVQKSSQKSLIVNLFGLLGSCLLLGLYTYTVVFPPPLSPTDMPDKVDVGGMLAKFLEAFLVGGIICLIYLERKKIKSQLSQTT